MLTIEYLDEKEDVFDITVEDNHNFYPEGLLYEQCSEILLPTKPLQFEGIKNTQIKHYDESNGVISLCILACINFGKLKKIDELDNLTRILVRFLDRLIDHQEYPLNASNYPTKDYRFLGIGISDFSHFLAKNEVSYKDSHNLVHEWSERFQYGLLSASIDLAKELGPCKNNDKSLYSDGVLPIDNYNKNVDSLASPDYKCDWDKLRTRLVKYGIRNTALSAIPPTASSSLVSSSTQGIDPVQNLEDTFELLSHTVKSVVPEASKYKDIYSKSWELANNNNSEYFKVIAIIQKFIDQGISTNQWYDLTKLPGRTLNSVVVKKDILTAWKYGMKTIYYLKSKDKDNISDTLLVSSDTCESGACSI